MSNNCRGVEAGGGCIAMSDVLELVNAMVADVHDVLTWAAPRNLYRCHICLTRDEQGVVSAVVLNLPGCGSCGDTVDEAIQNVREAILGVIESHIEAGERVPWVNSILTQIPKGATQRWIVVNAD